MKRAKGFSLLEAVVALGIVASVSVASLAAFAAQLRTAGRARASLEAAALAEDRLARVRLLPREELAHLPDSVARGRFDPPWDRFEWAASAGELVDRADLFEVHLSVSWPDGNHGLATRLFRPARSSPRTTR